MQKFVMLAMMFVTCALMAQTEKGELLLRMTKDEFLAEYSIQVEEIEVE